MKLSKILVLTLVAMLLVVGAAMATPACDHAGYTYSPTGNDFAGNCKEKGWVEYKCSYCNDEFKVSNTGYGAHVDLKWTNTGKPTCAASVTEYEYCEYCDQYTGNTKFMPALDHIAKTADGQACINATLIKDVDGNACTIKGEETWKCINCEATITITPKGEEGDGHNYKGARLDILQQPTCTEDGIGILYCVDCPRGQEATINANPADYAALKNLGGHKPVKDARHSKPAGCNKDGLTIMVCDVCGEKLSETVEPATDHVWSEGTQTVAPTCDATGKMLYFCKNGADLCDKYNTRENKAYTKTEDIPALGHDLNDATITTPATCTKDGEKTAICKRCGETVVEAVPAAHQWTEWKKTEKGEVRYCTACGEYEFKDATETPVDPEKPVDPSEPSNPGTSGGNSSSSSTSGVEIPATGDTSIAWAYIMVAASAIVLVAMKKRATNN